MDRNDWESTGPAHDTGNGALRSRSVSTDHPGVVRVDHRSYCGREPDRTWYLAVNDPQDLQYSTPAKAEERYRECVRLADQSAEIKQLRERLARAEGRG